MAGISRAVRAAIAASRAPSREIVQGWREGAEYRALVHAFDGCALDAAEPIAERCEALFADCGWLHGLLAPLMDALGGDPFFEPPFKISRDSLKTWAVLFDCPAASITAVITNAAAAATLPPPSALVVTGRMSVTATLASGGATLRRWRAEPLTPDFSATGAAPCQALPTRRLADGDVHRCDGRTHGQLADAGQSDLVQLVASIRPGAAPLMREYDVATGALLRVASADDRASRTEMLLSFLRLSGRADAGTAFEAVTHDAAFHLRWAAMREWLALDARAALPRLAAMAVHDPNGEVRSAATLTLVTVQRRLAEVACRG